MTFERTDDAGLIREIITHPRLYPWLTDEYSPGRDAFQPVMAEGIWYVLAYDNAGLLLGLFMFARHSPVVWEVHTCLLPGAWGEPAARAAREVAGWMFEHSGCQRIITHVPAYNRLAVRFAKAAGMTEYGRNVASFAKGGRLHDQIELGLSKGVV